MPSYLSLARISTAQSAFCKILIQLSPAVTKLKKLRYSTALYKPRRKPVSQSKNSDQDRTKILLFLCYYMPKRFKFIRVELHKKISENGNFNELTLAYHQGCWSQIFHIRELSYFWLPHKQRVAFSTVPLKDIPFLRTICK